MTKYAKKTDRNHKQFTAAFQGCGVPYQDTSRWPGMLDFLAETRGGRLVRFEVKATEAEPLTEAEARVFEMFPRNCYRVWQPEQALEIIFEGDQ